MTGDLRSIASTRVERHADQQLATFTLCKDKAGADQSVTVAREWIGKNASGINAPAPVITKGPV